MAKQQILLVDADASSARLLEVSLRSAGFTVAVADSAEVALAKLEHGTPDLVLTDTRLPKADGFTLVRRLRARPESAEVPVIFLTEQGALEDKLKGLELGVNDYLAKPIFVREVVTRVQMLLARKQKRVVAEPARTRFLGSLEDVAVVDLLQTIAVSGKSGVASVRRGDREAWLYFDRGQVIDASVGNLRGEEAVYRTITWTTGSFNLEFRASERQKVIDAPYQALLMEGLRRVDELGRIAEQLPPENSIIELDHATLASRLNEIPDELNAILRLIDGKRTLLDLIDASPFDDLSTLTVLSKFYFEGLISSIDPPEPAETGDSAAPSEPAGLAPSAEPAAAVATIDLFASGAPGPGSEHPEPSADEVSFAPSDPPAAGEVGEASTLVPPSRSTPPAAISTAPPPSRVERTPPPSTVPAELAQPRETASPITTRVTTPAPARDDKLTPKGIVNVGEQRPSVPKPAPAAASSPFRPVSEPPRRSPIPMPDNSLRWQGGARAGAAPPNGAQADDLRVTRTALGLSATPLQRPPVTAELSQPQAQGAADRDESPRAAASRVATASPLRASAAASQPRSSAARAGADAPPASAVARSPRAVATADDDGPASEASVPPSERESSEPPRPRQRRASAARRARETRAKVVVAAVLVLALTPIVIGLSRRLTWRTDPPTPALPNVVAPAPLPAPPSVPTLPPVPAAAVTPPPVTPPPVAPPPVALPIAPATAVVGDPSTPPVPPAPAVASEPPPSAAPLPSASPVGARAVRGQPPVATKPSEPRPAPLPRATRPPRAYRPVVTPPAAAPAPTPPAASAPTPPAAPAPAPPAAPAPAPPASRPAPPPVGSAAAPPPPKQGEKPPTAAYPLR